MPKNCADALAPLPAPPAFRVRGLTCRDLLAGLATLGVAVVLLVPALSRADELSQAQTCRANLHELARATQQYTAEHNERLPRPARGSTAGLSEQQKQEMLWFNALDPYLLPEISGDADDAADSGDAEEHADEQLLLLKHDPAAQAWDDPKRSANRTLKMNTYLRDDARERYRARMTDIQSPDDTVLLIDGRAADWHEPDVFSARRYDVSEGLVAPRHDDKANVAFADASVRAVEQDIRDSLAAPGWYPESDDRQTLTWRIYTDDD